MTLVASATPEVMTVPLPWTDTGSISMRCLQNQLFASTLKGKRSLGIGPGLTTHPETQQFVREVVGNRTVPIVLDADGLNAFAGRASELKNPRGMLAITPHPGEMARLVSSTAQDVQKNRIDIALKAAADWNAHVILKGHQTIIASPDGAAFVNSTGNPGMATGGTGDVLTGILAGLTAQYGAGFLAAPPCFRRLPPRTCRRYCLRRIWRSAADGHRSYPRNPSRLSSLLCRVRSCLIKSSSRVLRKRQPSARPRNRRAIEAAGPRSALSGDLGAGKTTLTKGIVTGLGSGG